MKRLLLLGAFCVSSFCFAAEPGTTSTPPAEAPQVAVKELALKIDPLSKEQTDTGLTADMLKETIDRELTLGSIDINDALSLPSLILRVRTIRVGLDFATYFQLSFQEEAVLARNRSKYYAVTWSQSSILACRPEDLKNEVIDTVRILTQSFVKDYSKAMKPRAQ